jgi:hypothetical protein
MPELLSLRFGSADMIISRLLSPTRLMRWPKVRELVQPTEFEGAYVLDDPAVPHTVYTAITNRFDKAPRRVVPTSSSATYGIMALSFQNRTLSKRLHSLTGELLPVAKKLLISLDRRSELFILLTAYEFHLET